MEMHTTTIVGITVMALTASLQAATVFTNSNLETNGGATGGGTTTTFTGWEKGSGSALVNNDVGSTTGVVPGGVGNTVFRIAKNSTIRSAAFSSEWDETTTFDITLNACEVSWKSVGTGNGIFVSLRSTTGTQYEAAEIVLDGTHDGTSQYTTWSTDQTHALQFVGADLMSDGAVEDQDLRLYIYSKNNNNSINWLDNIQVDVNTVAVPEPSSTALLGLVGLALILRRRN